MWAISVDYDPINTSNILDIHRCLMKKTEYKIIFGIIKKMFIALLARPIQNLCH